MVNDDIGFLANHFWRESLNNIQTILSSEEVRLFSGNDYYYLTTIYYMNQPSLSEVALALDMTKPAISALYKKLNKIGLLEKFQSKEDKRRYRLQLTKKGIDIVLGDEKMYKGLEQMIGSLASNPNELKIFEKMLKKIVLTLKADHK